MTEFRLRDETEPTVFVRQVAKQHDGFARAIAFGAFASSCARFWLDKMSRKLVESFNEDFPKLALVPPTVVRITLLGWPHLGVSSVLSLSAILFNATARTKCLMIGFLFFFPPGDRQVFHPLGTWYDSGYRGETRLWISDRTSPEKRKPKYSKVSQLTV